MSEKYIIDDIDIEEFQTSMAIEEKFTLATEKLKEYIEENNLEICRYLVPEHFIEVLYPHMKRVF